MALASYLAVDLFKAGGTALVVVTGNGDGVLWTNKPHVCFFMHSTKQSDSDYLVDAISKLHLIISSYSKLS